MNEQLIERADRLGIDWSMFYLLPAKQREKALLREITAAEKKLVRAKAPAGDPPE